MREQVFVRSSAVVCRLLCLCLVPVAGCTSVCREWAWLRSCVHLVTCLIVCGLVWIYVYWAGLHWARLSLAALGWTGVGSGGLGWTWVGLGGLE